MNNPYQPPIADVADVRSVIDLASRPKTVTIACGLLCVSLVSAAASIGVTLRDDVFGDETIPFYFSIGLAAFVMIIYAVEAVFIYCTYRRANWARWVLLGLYALGWVVMLVDQSGWEESTEIVLLLDVATAMLEIAAITLLFTSKARQWFSARSAGE